MATVLKLEELEIWQVARQYSKEVREILKSAAFDIEPGLKHQMKNASGSVMDNIAEGFGRGSKHEFVNHLSIAKGSLEETRSQLYRCYDQNLVSCQVFEALLIRSELLLKRITRLINYLNESSLKGAKFKNRQH